MKTQNLIIIKKLLKTIINTYILLINPYIKISNYNYINKNENKKINKK